VLKIEELIFRRETLLIAEEAEKGVCLSCGEVSPTEDDSIGVCPECSEPCLVPAKNLFQLAERLSGCRKIR
jgi:Zn finger protein HypA/HybF involved in hydrogenase expression